MTDGRDKWCDPQTRALFRAILKLRSVDEAARFFRDLMTAHELQEMRNRWLAVRRLSEGVPYKTIEEETGMSSRTLARIARWMRNGEGGYPMMLRRMSRTKRRSRKGGRTPQDETGT